MKSLIFSLLFLFIACGLFSCKKSSPLPVSIMGKWNLVSDSNYTQNYGAKPIGSLYIGSASDYYNFETNGKLSWSENNNGLNSSVYSLSANNTITITFDPTVDPNYIDSTFPYTITVFNDHKLILTCGPLPISGESVEYGQIITLRR